MSARTVMRRVSVWWRSVSPGTESGRPPTDCRPCSPSTVTSQGTTNDPLIPLDLDIHRIPENQAKGETDHWHFDFRYLYRTQETAVRLRAEEVGEHAWRSPADLAPARLTAKVSLYLAAL